MERTSACMGVTQKRIRMKATANSEFVDRKNSLANGIDEHGFLNEIIISSSYASESRKSGGKQ